jgi:hypothetical protein
MLAGLEASIRWVEPIPLIFANGWWPRLRPVAFRVIGRRGSLASASARRSGGWSVCARPAAQQILMDPVAASNAAKSIAEGRFCIEKSEIVNSHQNGFGATSGVGEERRFGLLSHVRMEGGPEVMSGSRAGYSITRFATARTVGGISMPSDFAVLRLIISSNLVGCSIGRSAGLAPGFKPRRSRGAAELRPGVQDLQPPACGVRSSRSGASSTSSNKRKSFRTASS